MDMLGPNLTFLTLLKNLTYPDETRNECTRSGAFDVTRRAGGLSRIVSFILKPGTCTLLKVIVRIWADARLRLWPKPT